MAVINLHMPSQYFTSDGTTITSTSSVDITSLDESSDATLAARSYGATAKAQLHLYSNTGPHCKWWVQTSDEGGDIGDMMLEFVSSQTGFNSGNNVASVAVDYEGGLFFKNYPSTEPAAVANGCKLYAKDVTDSSELFVRDEAGNITQLSPHNSDNGEWWFNSTRNGKVFRVHMEKLVRFLQEQYPDEDWIEED